MKKIAFFVQHMLCGGVENSLIALTNELKIVGHDVTIYVVMENGEFIKKIPKGVNINSIPLSKKILKNIPIGGAKLTLRKNLKDRNYLGAIITLKNYLFGKSEFAELNVDFNQIAKLPLEYDIAVNFHMHSPFLVRYLSEKVNAKKKISWIHNDFSTTKYDIKKLQQYLDCCSEFYGVSKQIVDEFVEIFPEYKSKSKIMYNILPIEEIIYKGCGEAPEFERVKKDSWRFLSVGRLEAQKGYDITIDVCKQLLDLGYKFQWLVLGEGSERGKLEELVKKNKLEDVIFFIGIRLNPYPYFKKCDLYIQTSKHEGYVTTVTEAKIFNRPIICTDVSGAREQIDEGINGHIVGFDTKEIVEKIIKICENNEFYKYEFDYRDLNQNIEQNLKIFS